ncbi:MAG: RidA family protein [Limnochordaceae bacterium]|nr:RidA family protein [Limnochordaceae bacterium]
MKRPVSSDQAPAAVGPYSQAIRTGGLIFVSGQIPLDPATGELVQGPVEAQVRRALANVEAVLRASGATLAHVVKATIYLRSMADFPEVNRVWAQIFPDPPPARSTVAVAELPKGALVEVDVIAVDPSPSA